MRRIALMFCLTVPLLAQQGPVNLNFNDSGPEGQPTGWASSPSASYSVATVDDCRVPNTRCAMVRREAGNHPTDSVYILQSFDATALRGKLVRYRASLRLQTTLSVAQIFVRVDRPSGVGFSEYSPIRASRSTDWTTLEVGGPIDEDAKRITIGLVYRGLGYAYFADAEFETFDNHL